MQQVFGRGGGGGGGEVGGEEAVDGVCDGRYELEGVVESIMTDKQRSLMSRREILDHSISHKARMS